MEVMKYRGSTHTCADWLHSIQIVHSITMNVQTQLMAENDCTVQHYLLHTEQPSRWINLYSITYVAKDFFHVFSNIIGQRSLVVADNFTQ